MESSILSTVILPLSLALIMVGIGLELRRSDFSLLFEKPKSVLIGLAAQMIFLPLLGILIGFYLFNFSSPLIAAGFIILTLSPGGVTSNLMSYLAKADTALSVSLTVLVSLITPFWLPLAAAFILSHIEEVEQIHLDLAQTIINLLVISVIPVLIGMFIRSKKASLAKALQKPVKIISTVFLFLIIISLVLKNADVLKANVAELLPASLLLVVLAFFGGFFIAKLFKLAEQQQRSISIEVGMQNGTLALFVTASLLQIPEMTLATMFYSLIMFLVGFFVVLYFIRRDKKS